jgi:heme oxygenase (biliverdin-IX-beta and delta-forming)
MERQVLEAIRDMVATHRVLGLAVLVDGDPEASLLPYAVRADYGAVYVQASGLARHSKGLQPGARVGVLIHEHEAADADPLQTKRMTVQATVAVLDRESEAFAAAREVFVGRLPGAEMTLNLGDFNLYELTLGRGRYIAGFGQAYNIGPDTFREIAELKAN